MPRIVQLTDLHLSTADRFPRGFDPWGAFAWALEEARAWTPDALVITGDIALDVGDLETYHEVAALLREQPFDWIVLPGNHDDRSIFGHAFGRRYTSSGALDALITVHGFPMIVVDSSVGEVGPKQRAWLDAVVQDASQRARAQRVPLVVWMHHPPCVGIHRFMDANYALRDHAAVMEILRAAGVPVQVFCGHYHSSIEISVANVNVTVTPSLYLQIDPHILEFTIAAEPPAFRVIDIETGGAEDPVHHRLVQRRARLSCG